MNLNVFKDEILIKEKHLDTMGHMNNATYLAIFEEARWDIVTKGGYGIDYIHKIKQGPVILDVNLKFLKEIHLREKIMLTMQILDYAKKVGQLKQQMIKEDGTVAAEAVFSFGLFDLKDRKLIEPTPAWKKDLGLQA